MPYLPESRQYRDFAASNFQPVLREAQDGQDASEPSYTVRGHFSVFDVEYELWPGVYESVAPTAFDNADTSDCLFQFNHRDMVLARKRNGSLRTGVDEVGGWAEADLSGCQQGRDLYEAISNGLIDRMSFGFILDEDGWEDEEDEDGNLHIRITSVKKIFDVSAVDLPASEATDISARSLVDSVLEAKKQQEELAKQEQLEAE